MVFEHLLKFLTINKKTYNNGGNADVLPGGASTTCYVIAQTPTRIRLASVSYTHLRAHETSLLIV